MVERKVIENKKNDDWKKTEEIVLGYEKLMGKIFPDREAAKRIVFRLLQSRVIQGPLDKLGDKLIYSWVENKTKERNFPIDNQKMKEFLNSNFYLNKVYRNGNFPMDPTMFLNEKIKRHGKRPASLLEWTVGFIFLLYRKFGPLWARKVCNQIMDNIFEELKPGHEKELEVSLSEFEKVLQDRKINL